MRKLFIAAFVLASPIMLLSLGAPAHAQVSLGNGSNNPQAQADIAEKREREAVDREYKATLKRTNPVGQAQTSSDPWRTVRDDKQPKR
ncbi:MAG TPA: hypothetical protein VFB45_16380 [Pseudolabrys sp.]|nr:hypothetical protein [Pseudolabrys sp.]